jgi:vacuolar-type H+-ATPase subunit E/Vma4
MEAAQAMGEVRRRIVESTLIEVRCRFAAVRADDGYAATLRRLAEEALQHISAAEDDGGSPVLDSDPRDESLLRQMLPAGVSIHPSIESWGGVVAHSADGNITVDNTLEARLERAMPFLRVLIEKELDG